LIDFNIDISVYHFISHKVRLYKVIIDWLVIIDLEFDWLVVDEAALFFRGYLW